MGIRKYKPTSPGRRGMTVLTTEALTRKKPERALTESLSATGGRNNLGEITVWHRGGGHRRKYRIIDFKRDKLDIPATVAAIEYDPNRSARIALLSYADGEKRYIIAPLELQVGERMPSGEVRLIPQVCLATIGEVGNLDHSNVKLGKAGRKRHLGIRPTVRGTAMSPRDHPHGGGEGRQPIGKPGPRTPWGKPTRGHKTRNK